MPLQTRKFVIVKHTTPENDAHWDFMLDTGDTLATWRINIPPQQLAEQTAPAEKIFDHPKKFLTYEGPVNKGKGSVKIEETGTCQMISDDNNQLKFHLNGTILKGHFALTKTSENKWKFTPEK